MAFPARRRGGLFPALKGKGHGCAAPIPPLAISADCRNLHSAMLPLLLQLTGGGLVPLSRARCCRPCLPAELPDSQGQLSPEANPVAVVSIGCHKSSGQGSDALKCEPQGSSFVTGFGQAIRVSNAADYYYPVGAVDCCTPSVLLSTGEAWELERCDCDSALTSTAARQTTTGCCRASSAGGNPSPHLHLAALGLITVISGLQIVLSKLW